MLPYTEFLLTKSTLPPRHRELLWLRTAWLARSDYLWAQRAPAARRAGVTRRRARADRARARRARLGAVRGRALARGRRAARRRVRERRDLGRARRALRRESAHGPRLRRGRDCDARGVREHAQDRDRAGAQGPVAVRHRLRARGAANERAPRSARRRASSRCRRPRAPRARTCSARSRAIHRPTSCATRSVATFATRLRYAAQPPAADHACRRAVPLGVRVGRALADRPPSRSRATPTSRA